jgi:hypothetical protein
MADQNMALGAGLSSGVAAVVSGMAAASINSLPKRGVRKNNVRQKKKIMRPLQRRDR